MSRLIMLMHEEGGRFGASFPDLPGCITVAGDPDTLVAKAMEVAAFHVTGMIEDGLDVPDFRSLTDLNRDGQFREDADGAVIVLLDVDLPTRAIRVNITVDEGMLRRIDRAAEAAGESRSGYLMSAARARLQAVR